MKKAWLSFFSGEAWVANPLMLSPAMGCLLIFFIFPMIATVVVSFTDWELGGTNSVHFIGWDNYIGLWESDDFRKSVGNTLFMTMLVVPTSFVLSLLLALAVHASGRLAQFWQSIYFLPVTASLVAMAVVWQWILHPEVGIVAAVLPYFGITQKVNFLNDARFVLWTLSFITVWQMTGYFMVIFLTGLVQIPQDLYEAARVDGAKSTWSLFANITWPLLSATSFSRLSRRSKYLILSRYSHAAVPRRQVKFSCTRCIKKGFRSSVWEQLRQWRLSISLSCCC